MTADRDTQWRMSVSRVEFHRYQRADLSFYWVDASRRILIRRNVAGQTFTARLGGEIVGARYYTIQNAARAAVRVMRGKQP